MVENAAASRGTTFLVMAYNSMAPCSHGLRSHGLNSYGLYIVMAYTVMLRQRVAVPPLRRVAWVHALFFFWRRHLRAAPRSTLSRLNNSLANMLELIWYNQHLITDSYML